MAWPALPVDAGADAAESYDTGTSRRLSARLCVVAVVVEGPAIRSRIEREGCGLYLSGPERALVRDVDHHAHAHARRRGARARRVAGRIDRIEPGWVRCPARGRAGSCLIRLRGSRRIARACRRLRRESSAATGRAENRR